MDGLEKKYKKISKKDKYGWEGYMKYKLNDKEIPQKTNVGGKEIYAQPSNKGGGERGVLLS